jgi:hypothetical protein
MLYNINILTKLHKDDKELEHEVKFLTCQCIAYKVEYNGTFLTSEQQYGTLHA